MGKAHMKVVDRWTTQHGSWDVNPENKYGIDQAHRDKYEAGKHIPPAGADHHIVVLCDTHEPYFRTEAGQLAVANMDPKTEWYNFPMSRDAGYSPDKGQRGPWQVWVNGQMVADGIGLPDGEHVSTFLVISEGGPDVVNPNPKYDSYLVIDGVTVWHN